MNIQNVTDVVLKLKKIFKTKENRIYLLQFETAKMPWKSKTSGTLFLIYFNISCSQTMRKVKCKSVILKKLYGVL